MYGKIFDSIYDGTLYGHWEAIVTMQQLLVLCTRDGIIDMTPQAIAARTSIPLEIITNGLGLLAEPDQYSRTPGEEGRRIVLMDGHRPWGWVIVNHAKYQAIRDRAAKNEADRIRISGHRKALKSNDVADCSNSSQPVADVAPASASASASATKTKPARNIAQKPETRNPPASWLASEEGTTAKGKELGLEARPGESWPKFRERILRNLDKAKA